MPEQKDRIESPTARGLDERALKYSASIAYDRRLYRHDIAASIAHARMLAKQVIGPGDDGHSSLRGVGESREEIERGEFPFGEELEDIHLNIEARLHEKIGEAAGRLHTARSRNDQIATDMRLFVMEACDDALLAIRGLQTVLLDLAEANQGTIMPGYTHLQRAQPVLFAHHLLAYLEMLDRDSGRLRDCRLRADELPLGAGALAGAPYPLDREFVASELGFSGVSRTSMDAVADRDFVIEFQAAAATAMMHLSRLAEEIVLWCSDEFSFVRLADMFATGSSIMPQKRNPDVPELARGRAGRVYGNLMAILTTPKGLPLRFDQDVLTLDVRASIAARDVPGGTAPSRVAEALRTARERLKEDA